MGVRGGMNTHACMRAYVTPVHPLGSHLGSRGCLEMYLWMYVRLMSVYVVDLFVYTH